jgi:cholesterol oxidase
MPQDGPVRGAGHDDHDGHGRNSHGRNSHGRDDHDCDYDYDYDVIVVGSGFGGSVSALRLAEKGYRVGVLEAGRRFTRETLPKNSWDLRNYPPSASTASSASICSAM